MQIIKLQSLLVGVCLVSMDAAMAMHYPYEFAPPPSSYSGRGVSTSMVPAAPEIVTVTTTRTGSTIVLGGTVVPFREVTLSAEIPGRIDYLAGVEGDWFEPGQVIAAVDDDDLRARERHAMAEISSQQAALRNAQVQYGREYWSPQSRNIGRNPGMGMPSLFDMFFTRPFGSAMGYGNPWLDRHADLYQQGTHLGQASSQHIGALSRYQEVQAQIRDSRAVAPFAGVIVERLAEVGDTVQPGQPIVKFADTRYLQLQVEVPTRLMPGLQADMVVPALLDVGNARVSARVAQIYPVANTQRHTVTVKFDLPEGIPGGPGMYAEVMVPDVNAPIHTLPVIPSSSVVWRGSLPAVFILNNENQTQLRLVRLGEALDDHHVTVLSGIRAGERIYVRPTPGMASGWKADASTTTE